MTAVFSTTTGHREEVRRDVQVARWVATVAGLVGFVLSVLTPLLPVVQTTATLNWPQNGAWANVTVATDLAGAGVPGRERPVRGDPLHAARRAGWCSAPHRMTASKRR